MQSSMCITINADMQAAQTVQAVQKLTFWKLYHLLSQLCSTHANYMMHMCMQSIPECR